jgi:nucleotide-binding universal stress UspA family protein
MKTVLVATDFSENAKVALQLAREIAIRYQAKLLLVNAFHPPVIDPNMPIDISVMMSQEAEKVAQEQLALIVKEYQQTGVNCEGIVRVGAAADVLLDEIKTQKPILTLMGRTGTGGWLDKLFGSVAATVIAQTDSPILVIPPNVEKLEINQILYATELEHVEEDALDFVFDFAEYLGAKVTLLKVKEDFQVDVFSDEAFIEAIGQRYAGKPYTLKTIEATSVTSGLQHYADEHDADLLVMATRKRDWLAKLINPSISKEMVLSTHTPLLVCHIED